MTPVAYAHFGVLVNNGNYSGVENDLITCKVEFQVSNSSRNRNGHVIGVRLQAYIGGALHLQEHALNFTVGEY